MKSSPTPKNTPPATQSAPYSAYVRLRDMILRGELPPGERLVERTLSERLLVSRIPLREALVRLQAEGLVQSVRNTATYVSEFSIEDLLEIYSLRLRLEPFAARLAAKHADAEVFQTLRSLCSQMTKLTSRPSDWLKLDDCDYEFHRTIVQASQHSRLIRAYDISQIRILGLRDEYRLLQKAPPTAMAEEHLEIVAALEKGDPDKAEKVNYDHVHDSMQSFIRSYKLHGKAV